MQEKYNVGIYCRLSRDDERTGESVSIENQKILAQKSAASMEQTKVLRATLAAVEKRLAELEKLMVAAYEDKVKGVMPEALCVQLMNRYEDERRSKLEQRTQLSPQAVR